GPLVLSAALESAREQPVVLSEVKDIPRAVSPAPEGAPVFRGTGIFRALDSDEPREVTLVPFFRMHDRPYIVYWDAFTADQWSAKREELRAEQERQRALEARTVDLFQPGEMQPERDHNFRGENSQTGDFQGRKWRHASDGGWFSFEMKVDPMA